MQTPRLNRISSMMEHVADSSLLQRGSGGNSQEQDRILSLFHPDPERARQECERLCLRLAKMCECRGVARTEEFIDRTFQIVTRELINEKISAFTVRVAQKLLDEMSQEDFDRLLMRLDPDRTRAGTKYEEIRNQLVRFFSRRNCQNPEDLADKSLDRLAKRSAQVNIENFSSYAREIAKFVIKESWRAPEQIPIESEPDEANLSTSPDRLEEILGIPNEEEDTMSALEQCLEQLDQNKRDLILAFYDAPPKREEFRRKRLARQAGISLQALTTRACRIRHTLRIRVKERLANH